MRLRVARLSSGTTGYPVASAATSRATGSPAGHLLAGVRVEVHAPQPVPLVSDGGGPAGLVVRHHEPALVVELQPVDDPPHRQAADPRLEPKLEADGPHPVGVLQAEVGTDQ